METTEFNESLTNYHRYRYETARIASFSRGNWPLSWEAAVRLATGGFWHESNGRVCCFDCELTLSDWSEADDPSLVHTLHQYRRTMCRFARRLPCGNVPIGARHIPIPMPQLQDSIGVVGADTSLLLRMFGVDTMYRPEYPRFKHLSARLRSFDTWPVGIAQKRKPLADAGFIYFGVSDTLVCYHCGVSLGAWEPNDDPWIEHAKKSPYCQHVIMIKGVDFINAHTEFTFEKDPNNCELVLPTGVLQIETLSAVNSDAELVRNLTETNDHSTIDEKTVECNGYEPLCKICYNSTMNAVVLPCGHMATCLECLVSMSKCIICRESISHYVKVYLA